MPDRDKVSNGLCEAIGIIHAYIPKQYWGYGEQACRDALSLLKEQDAVEPIPPADESDLWKCGNCNHQLFRCTHQRYCEMCGRAVKWDAQ